MNHALPDWLLRQAAALLQAHYPEEGCGLILQDHAGALSLRPCPNLAPDPRRGFRLDPLAILRAQAQGLALWGIYHSHCDQSPWFSQEDRRGARLYPGCGHLVLSLRGGQATEAALWRLDPRGEHFARTACYQL